jgi:competence protein ComEC
MSPNKAFAKHLEGPTFETTQNGDGLRRGPTTTEVRMRRILVVGSLPLLLAACAVATEPEPVTPQPPGPGGPLAVAPLVVEVLDVGQGDAIWIENGRSKVLIDAGQSTARMAEFIAEKRLAGDTLDVMILTHAHADHHGGMRAFFQSAHNITVRRFYENQDPATGVQIAELRDSATARVRRGQMQYLDTDDACLDGRPICTHTLDGGAKLHILRPLPAGSVNDRSVAVKLIGPDSASFTMWLSGDAEGAAMRYFEDQYAASPGLRVRVLKGNHHGSCNGVSARWLELTRPEWTTFGVSSGNGFGHVHEQTKNLHRAAAAPWLRSDANGRITFRTPGTPGSGYTVNTERPGTSLNGQGDRAASESTCHG